MSHDEIFHPCQRFIKHVIFKGQKSKLKILGLDPYRDLSHNCLSILQNF